ncbi:YjbF family lipoprotein [Parasedimentitalea huanghaiensis]|uniref:YjbF family lipoprotein n=1 Tax=Parasedimentitalea huanghaiensis TaxID=2682100 RepID=A0A6L6WLZ3_9RHOB|nr:YjbF family lipoprotein [Zongyanglinia huanghaiensis]MVO18511.1 YjbF family lipoprotein [Zongyanglinia huanghaiensis]
MRILPVKWAAVLGLALLAGCSQGPDGPTLELEVFQLLQQRVASIGGAAAAPVERPPLTRAALDTVEGPYIEVTVENRDIFAYLSQQLVRRDDSPGEIVVWRTEDNITLTLRSGVLVATRGLGDDILSASAPVATGKPGPVMGGARSYQIRGLDNKTHALVMVCSLLDLGPAPVEIVEVTYPTRHMQERCETQNSLVVNDYWVDSRSGRVWQSRQWAGPTIGYLRIRQLTI